MTKQDVLTNTLSAANNVLISINNSPDINSLNKWTESLLRYDFNDRDTVQRTRGQSLLNLLEKLNNELSNKTGSPIDTINDFISQLTSFAADLNDLEANIVFQYPFPFPFIST
jgi:hypothetical protein